MWGGDAHLTGVGVPADTDMDTVVDIGTDITGDIDMDITVVPPRGIAPVIALANVTITVTESVVMAYGIRGTCANVMANDQLLRTVRIISIPINKVRCFGTRVAVGKNVKAEIGPEIGINLAEIARPNRSKEIDRSSLRNVTAKPSPRNVTARATRS